MSNKSDESRHTRRDAETLTVLGVFLMVLAVPVLVGTLWAEGAVPRAVNVAAALIVGGLGAVMTWRGKR